MNTYSAVKNFHAATQSTTDDTQLYAAESYAGTRLITDTRVTRRYEHITPTLRDTLHWLPISQLLSSKLR